MKRYIWPIAIVTFAAVLGSQTYKAIADSNAPDQVAAAPDSPMPPPDGPGPRPWGPMGPAGGPDMRGGPGQEFGHHHDMDFSLFAHVDDKNLSPADVKIIATALLLEHGNHSWTVADVATQPDKSIKFSFDSAKGDVIASFAMDPKTGHIKRVG